MILEAKHLPIVGSLKLVGAIVLSSLLQGCYYMQAVGGHWSVMRQREPIEELLQAPDTDPALAAQLQQVTALLEFAVTELELPDNGSYRSYVELDRPNIVTNVVAAEALSVEPITWCFAFAGCVAYRGYFSADRAVEFARSLENEGHDVAILGATAYSTLGWFKDPLLNTMLARGTTATASLIFHELAHQKLYRKDASDFNESFASVIEEYGTRAWLSQRQDAAALADYEMRVQRGREFGALIASARAELAEIYGGPGGREQKLAAKAAAFAALEDRYRALRACWGGFAAYDGWFAQPLNNAHLASIATYRAWAPVLRGRLERLGLSDFYREMEELAAAPEAVFRATLERWSISAGADRPLAGSGAAAAPESSGARDPAAAVRCSAI